METNYFLFRHALATRSTKGYGDKILTAEILPGETGPIKKMAGFFKSGVVSSTNYRSELIRCRQTADIISGITGKKFLADRRLNEFYLESFSDFRNRILEWLMFVKKMIPENLIVCTHGSVIAGIQHFVIQNDFPESKLYEYPECGELLIIKNKKISRINFN